MRGRDSKTRKQPAREKNQQPRQPSQSPAEQLAERLMALMAGRQHGNSKQQ